MPFLDTDDRKLIIDEVEDELLALEGDMLVDEVDSESAEEITECESEEILEVSEPPVKKKKKVQSSSLENCFTNIPSHHIHCLPIPAKWLKNWNCTKLKDLLTLTQTL